ncbi:MAG: glutaredoxin family protein [Meiothermus sp.]|uniref:glutaredoxin family protein n=1 Tax=Meiothermus sp. TaxID=1955249 RepID=UPI0025FDFD29|nr:glutaredoxin family protein [Meiothermus sp.]MCS7195395.1 glutaredoxin family protein [Meiothermus sp.]MDW8091004.1 glutaredoxin family protein [Meiothermus sp.]
MELVLISRKGCHLCEEAEALLKARGLAYRWVDVDADAELRKLYTFRVPVLLLGRAVLLEGKFTPERLEKKLEALRGPHPG